MRVSFKFQALIALLAIFLPFSVAYAHEAIYVHTHDGEETSEATESVPQSTPTPTLISENVSENESSSSADPEIQGLLDQISALLSVVEALQAQLAVLQSGGTISNEFTRNLSVGDEGLEVLALQQMLNDNPKTRVANSGPGSRGLESTYYGSLTANAVSRFQELYASDILTPVGLTRGSGYFGPSTRAKMNALIKAGIQFTLDNTPTSNNNSGTETVSNETTSNQNQNNLNSSALSGTSGAIEASVTSGNTGLGLQSSGLTYETSDEFSVGKASSYAGAPGESITVEGVKLTNSTKINFENTAVTGIASSDGKSLTFVVPNVNTGPYFLTFDDGAGLEALRVMDFVVTIENATAPEIYSISPSLGPTGTMITISGSGFTATNNTIEFGQKVVSGISSPDGTTLNVAVYPEEEIPPGGEWPVFVYLSNANGRALNPSVFIIRN